MGSLEVAIRIAVAVGHAAASRVACESYIALVASPSKIKLPIRQAGYRACINKFSRCCNVSLFQAVNQSTVICLRLIIRSSALSSS